MISGRPKSYKQDASLYSGITTCEGGCGGNLSIAGSAVSGMSMARKYCLITALAALLLVGGVAAFNAVVDPYGMYRLFEVKGFNMHKPAIYNRVRLMKAFDIRRVRPDAIVLGTSRSHVAMRMSHRGWDPIAKKRYNLAFDGATTKEMYFYLRFTQAVHPLKQVVLGLDTYHPTLAPGSTRPDFDQGLLFENRSLVSFVCMVLEDLKLLASVDTLIASIKTVLSQNAGGPEWFTADGQRSGEIFFRDFEDKFQKCPRDYFEEIDRMEVGFKMPDRKPAGVTPVMAVSAPASGQKGDDETSLGYIRRIVEFCRDYHIDLRIFITPEHAHQAEISAAVGAWPSVEEAKRNLVRLLADDAASHPGKPPVPLYDFSGYNSVTIEPLPEPGSRNEMKYYWDSSHFKEIVGDFILDRLFGISRRGHPVPEDFGVLLTPATVETELDRIRAGRAAYRRSHPQDIAVIRSDVENYSGNSSSYN